LLFYRLANPNHDKPISKKERLNIHQTLKTYHKRSPYLFFARQLEAKHAVDQHKLQEAQEVLEKTLTHTAVNTSLKNIASLRLARVYLALQQPREALRILKNIQDTAFDIPLYFLKAQAFQSLKDKKAAVLALEKVLEAENPEQYDLIITLARAQMSAVSTKPLLESPSKL